MQGSARPAQLVGRDADLKVLDASLDDLAAGRWSVIEVAGEPGIGKTRLLSELRGRGEARGYLVLTGRVADFEKTLPFGPFVAAFEDYLAAMSDDQIEGIGSEELSELAGVFPALARFAVGRPTLQEERYRSYRAVRSLLETLSWRRPLVVALDDLQWADAASGELLGHLLRSPPRGPVLLALAFRPAQLATPMAATLEQAARRPTVNRLDLTALNPDEAGALLGLDEHSDVRAQLHHLSGGNPFYLEQLARSGWAGRGPLAGTQGAPATVPLAVREALAAEIAAVAPAARHLLDAGAVAGDPFDLDLAAGIAELAPPQALSALDDLTVAELVHPTEAPRRFSFRHPLLRWAVYESTGPGWRLAAHARAAARLAGKGSIASQALHVERSASVGDSDALGVLTEAGRTAKDPLTAAQWYRAALRLLPDNDETAPQRLELMAATVEALSAAGRLGECRQLLGEILAVLPPGRARRRQLVACACVEHLLGRLPEAQRRLVEALDGVSDRRSAEAVRLQIELCGNALLRSDAAQALPLASSALLGAEALQDRVLMAVAAAVRLQAQYLAASAHVATPDLARAVELVDSLDDAEFARRPDAAVWLGGAEYHLERFEDAMRHLRRVVEVSRANGKGHLLNASQIFQARAAVSLGRLADAGQLVEGVVAAARLSANPRVTCRALAVEAYVACARGDADQALSSAQESYALIPERDPGELSALAGWALGSALLAAGHAERSRSVLIGSAGGADLPLVWPTFRCDFYEALTELELALGNGAEAEDWAGRAETTAAALPLALPAAAASRARALVLLADGNAQEAATLAMAAATRAEGVSAVIDCARSRLQAGRALAASGRRPEAVRQLQRAEDELAACGAEGHRANAARELRKLGRRVGPRRRRADAPTELSPRQLEIAGLLAENYTNREIATELYISEKTVESHLSHIFTKLGVSSRRAAARKVTSLAQP